MVSNRFIVELPSDRQIQGVRWLILKEDAEHTGGWFLFGHRNLNEGSDFDRWYLTRLEALREATSDYGVEEVDWKPAP